MIEKMTDTHWVKLYLSGPIEVAKQILRKEFLRKGICVTIEPTTFIYTGGEEIGYVVGFVNYPRFPTTDIELEDRAKQIALLLLEETYQHSVLFVTPKYSVWYSKRAE